MGLLLRCHERAMEIYNEKFRPILPLCDPRRMPTILHELIIQEARRAFTDIVGVVPRDPSIGDRYLLEVDHRLIVQFKKFTKDFRTENNPTQTSRRFDEQELGPGLPPYARLTAGYQLDEYNTAMSGVFLAFVVGYSCPWHHDLRTGEHDLSLDFPQPEGPSAAQLERQREEWEKLNEGAEEERA